MNLISIYERPDRALVLHQLLEERDDTANISHKAMPSWDEHVRFVESKPYQAWYFIEDNGDGRRLLPEQAGRDRRVVFKAASGQELRPLGDRGDDAQARQAALSGERQCPGRISASGKNQPDLGIPQLGFKHVWTVQWRAEHL
jgi:hypothetical protein